MITVLDSINLSAQYLSQKGIESPRTNAELLLADILGCKRLDLYLTFERRLVKRKYKDIVSKLNAEQALNHYNIL
jgi:release factor glutamine methyltransferase